MKKKTIFYTCVMIALSALLIFIGNKLTTDKYSNELLSKTSFYLDTFVTVQVYDSEENYSEKIQTKEDIEKLINNAIKICGNYELYFSKTNINSELYLLNESSKDNIRISKELYEVIDKSLYYSKISEGKFDVTISKLTDIWDFKKEIVPDELMISQKIRSVNYENIALSEINGNYYIAIANDSDIDLGGIAKGYIADKIKFYLVNHGIKSGMINLGGNMLVIGDKPDHTDYNIGIRNPSGKEDDVLCSVQVDDKAVVTSGTYERMFKKDGISYHHIIDPDTGHPSSSGIVSATVITKNAADADALSTICILLGYFDALELINELDGVECVLITDDNNIIISSGLKRTGKVITFK